jgi:hypothetical protein
MGNRLVSWFNSRLGLQSQVHDRAWGAVLAAPPRGASSNLSPGCKEWRLLRWQPPRWPKSRSRRSGSRSTSICADCFAQVAPGGDAPAGVRPVFDFREPGPLRSQREHAQYAAVQFYPSPRPCRLQEIPQTHSFTQRRSGQRWTCSRCDPRLDVMPARVRRDTTMPLQADHSSQKGAKPLAADWPCLPTASDGDVGKCGAGGCVKQLLTLRDVDEHIARQALGYRWYGHQDLKFDRR